MEQLTGLEELQRHVGVLACIDETQAPFVSCYLDLARGEAGYRMALDDRAFALRATLDDDARTDFEAALGQIEAYLAERLRPDAQGVALFVRQFRDGGFFLPMQFAVPLPNWLVVNPSPHIYHLIALKDTYHRYVVMIATQAWVRIAEVSLGAATVKAWTEQPELRARVGREWTQAHYESYRREDTTRFLTEQIELLQRLMAAGGQTHLILAGDPRLTSEIRRVLPPSVTAKLVDTIPVTSRDAAQDVVAATLSAFVEWEEQESQAVAARFIRGIRTQGLAAVGAAACMEALRQRRADVLLLARDYKPEPGRRCASCGAFGTEREVLAACRECGQPALRLVDTREELIRLAGQRECPVEVVEYCDPLMALGGVGCLLRYRAPVDDAVERNGRYRETRS